MIDFWHKSFQEFLAARVLVDQNEDRELLDHCSDIGWREVIIWACSRMRQKRASAFIRALLDASQGALDESEKAYIVGLALSCAHSALQLDESIQVQLEDLAKSLVTPLDAAMLEIISQLGPAAVPVLVDSLFATVAVHGHRKLIEEIVLLLAAIGGDLANGALAGMPDSFKRALALPLGQGWSSTGSEAYARRVLGSVPYNPVADDRVLVEIETLRQLRTIDYLSQVYRPAVRIFWNGFDEEDLGPGSHREIPRAELTGEYCWADVESFLRFYTAVDDLTVFLSEDLLACDLGKEFPGVHGLTLRAEREVTFNLDVLAVFPDLADLEIAGPISLVGPHGFLKNPWLRRVAISTSGNLTEVRWAGDLVSLSVSPWPMVSLRALAGLRALKHLDLSESDSLQSLDGARDLPNLEELVLRYCENLSDVDDALYSPSLSTIDIEGCDEVSSAEFMDINVVEGEESLCRLNEDSPTPDYIADRWMYWLEYEGLSDGEIRVRGWDDWTFWEEIKGDADEWVVADPVNRDEESLDAKGLTLYPSFLKWIERQAEFDRQDDQEREGIDLGRVYRG